VQRVRVADDGRGAGRLGGPVQRLEPPVPVVVVTGYSERDDIASAHGKEIDAVLVKPVDPDVLAAAVADDSALTPEERSARSGLANRQLTIR